MNLLRWIGNKRRVVDKIFTHFPNECDNYYEPFVGGGSVLCYVLRKIKTNEIKVRGTIYAFDINSDLIQMYHDIQRNPHELLLRMNTLQEEYHSCQSIHGNVKPSTKEEALESKESYYYWCRTYYNSLPINSIERSAYFIFLNRTCFRGMYRVDSDNKYNVPFGNISTVDIADEHLLRYLHDLLQPVQFKISSVESSLVHVTDSDFVYLDPPLISKSNFNLELFQMCQQLPCDWIMSYVDRPLIYDWFPDQIVHLKNQVLIHNF